MIKTILIASWLYLLTLMFVRVCAQDSAEVFQLKHLPKSGVILNSGWYFHPGDNPTWAKPDLDDQKWIKIDPTKGIQNLPQIERAGISWIRLRINTGRELSPVLCYMFQSVASDIYLDGRLLYRFGNISVNPDSVRAYNPYAAFSLPLQPGKRHVLAIRMAYQPGLDYEKIYFGRLPSLVRFNLFPAAEIPAIPIFNIESIYLDSFRVGLCFILCILHLSLFFAYRQQRANLYAAGMYGLMGCQAVLRAASDLMHSLEARTILGYSAYISPWINVLMLLIFYNLFNFRKGWSFWFTIGTIALSQHSWPSGFSWLSFLIPYWLTVELVGVAAFAIRRHQLGARTVVAGVLCHVSLSIVFWIISAYNVSITDHEWLFHGLYILLFLCIPLALSLRLSLEHGWINQQLSIKLQEVEELSAQNQAQQLYREQLLTRQNEELEHQVEVRTKELRQQTTQLKELDQAKSRFFTNLTHEFRTPLSLIISPVEKLLESTTLPDTQQTMLQTVARNARHLLNQVNQLLDLSRLEVGRMSIMLQPVQLGKLTTQLVDLFNSSAEAQQITLMLRIRGEDNVCLMDTDKWGKIVYNLLANALKFTSAGGQVDMYLDFEEEQIQLCVHDTGIGIDPNKLPYVFDRFYQTDDSITRSFEGSGVGLALVRELTDLLGGSVKVVSQPRQGSIFTVRLPVQTVSSVAPHEIAPFQLPAIIQPSSKIRPSEDSSFLNDQDNRASILVVEDNADLCQFIVDELSTQYQVLTAQNGRQGWTLVQKHLPDIVISDVMMPQMDGHELTYRIKNNLETDHIAVILLTARTNRTHQIEGLQQGADDYLIKPFDLTELRLRLSNLINRLRKLQAFYRKQLTQPAEIKETTSVTSTDPFLDRIYTLLESNLDNSQVSVEWLADQLSMDRKTLYRKLHSKIQLSPNDLIRTYRLRRGCELMRSGKSVTETAYSVGFNNVTYFGQCFKEQYQITPTDFINNAT